MGDKLSRDKDLKAILDFLDAKGFITETTIDVTDELGNVVGKRTHRFLNPTSRTIIKKIQKKEIQVLCQWSGAKNAEIIYDDKVIYLIFMNHKTRVVTDMQTLNRAQGSRFSIVKSKDGDHFTIRPGDKPDMIS